MFQASAASPSRRNTSPKLAVPTIHRFTTGGSKILEVAIVYSSDIWELLGLRGFTAKSGSTELPKDARKNPRLSSEGVFTNFISILYEFHKHFWKPEWLALI